MIDRDRQLERDFLERAERVSGVPAGFAQRVQEHLDQVEGAGGPDAPAQTAAEAFIGAHEEYVDGPCWTVVALKLLADEVEAGAVDEAVGHEVLMLAHEATAAAARAEQLARGAIALLGGP